MKISLLPTDSVPTLTDIIPTVDVETNTTKKVTVAALKTAMGGDITLYTGFDFVASGCVWSGDSYGVNRNASMTAGVIVIGGYPLTASAVTARSFTASTDTYIDAASNGSGGITLTYTEVANNAASPALAANNIRIGIIVTGATTIAAVGSVNQGQENKVLPIASSIPYTKTDSIGNLICSRDPQRRILGYRQRTTNFATTSVTAVQITELSVPVIVPVGRTVKVTLKTRSTEQTSAAQGTTLSIWEGVVGSGTQLNEAKNDTDAGSYQNPVDVIAIRTPSSTNQTYNGGYLTSAGTGTLNAGSTKPLFMLVELV